MKLDKTKLVEDLRKQVEELFALANKESKRQAQLKLYDYDEMTFKDFAAAEASLDECINETLSNNLYSCYPAEESIERYRGLLKNLPYMFYEYWKLSEKITDDDILASARMIRGKELKKLGGLRDKDESEQVIMPIAASYQQYCQFLIKFRYLLVLYAHKSKFYGSREAGKLFLRAISLIRMNDPAQVANFARQKVDEFIYYVTEGLEEFKIAEDYYGLEDWDKFSNKQRALIDKAKLEAKKGRDK